MGSILPMAIGLLAIPFLIKKIEVEAFGVLTLIWSLIGYFSIFDFGIGRALTHQISSRLGLNNDSEIPEVIKSGMKIMLIAGLIGGVFLYLFSHQLVLNVFNISKDLQYETILSIQIAAFGIPFTTITSGLKGILEGYEDFKTASFLRLIFGTANFGLPVLSVLIFDKSLVSIVVSLLIGRIIIMMLHLFFVHKKNHLKSILIAHNLESEKSKKLLSFGAWMTLSNLISPIMVTIDRFLISNKMGASMVAYYTVPFDFIVRLLIIPAALTTVLFPRFTYLFKEDLPEGLKLYKMSFYGIALIMGTICIILLFGSHFGLTIWLGSSFADASWLIAVILGVGLVFNSLAQIPHSVIQAYGDVKSTSLIHLLEFIIYIPLLYYSVVNYGLVGAAVAWVIRVLLDLCILSYVAKLRISTLNLNNNLH